MAVLKGFGWVEDVEKRYQGTWMIDGRCSCKCRGRSVIAFARISISGLCKMGVTWGIDFPDRKLRVEEVLEDYCIWCLEVFIYYPSTYCNTI